eukprot:TRINITY_DN12224_c0_g1_i1.p1 TRINITY_DN12224_c0_g1~~TRINITY_DN12224_c0_g1_i1.p1  ORF type:complete len:329 (+),score=30.65 TRINITY_DN12224_c0_g1_i1:102-989(+)
MGTTGTGKSSIVNMLYNRDYSKDSMSSPAPIGKTSNAVTQETMFYIDPAAGTTYCDTLGLSDPSKSTEEIITNLRKLLGGLVNGVTCLVVVAKFGRVSDVERANIRAITSMFDSRWCSQSVLVLTHYDEDFEDFDTQYKKWLQGDNELKQIVEDFSLVIPADNSLGRQEASNRPYRQNLLAKLQFKISSSSKPFGLKPVSIFEIIKLVLERYFELVSIAKNRLSQVIHFLSNTQGETFMGDCPICLEPIKFLECCVTECNHTYHNMCLRKLEAHFEEYPECPMCRTQITKLYMYL